MWRPKNPKAVALIKLTCWSGLVVWMVFFLAYGIVAARKLALLGPDIYWGFGSSFLAAVLHWVAPIFVVFVTLMVIWAVARFANKKLGRKKKGVGYD